MAVFTDGEAGFSVSFASLSKSVLVTSLDRIGDASRRIKERCGSSGETRDAYQHESIWLLLVVLGVASFIMTIKESLSVACRTQAQ